MRSHERESWVVKASTLRLLHRHECTILSRGWHLDPQFHSHTHRALCLLKPLPCHSVLFQMSFHFHDLWNFIKKTDLGVCCFSRSGDNGGGGKKEKGKRDPKRDGGIGDWSFSLLGESNQGRKRKTIKVETSENCYMGLQGLSISWTAPCKSDPPGNVFIEFNVFLYDVLEGKKVVNRSYPD